MATIAVLTTIDSLGQARAIYAISLSQVFEPYADWVAENSAPGEA